MPIESLIPYQNNPRVNKDAVKKVRMSIQEFGFKNPILIDDHNFIIAGHTRLLAAKELEMTEIPTIRISDLTDAQKRAYRIADNRIAEESKWDNDLLKLELLDLSQQNFNLAFTGFDKEEINSLLSPVEIIQSSDSSNPQFDVVVSCEDESDQEAVYKLMTSKGYKCRILSI